MQEMHKKYFRTAEFAQMAGLNKKTLHYYDEIGLFRPAYVNEKGYRFYTVLQLDRLALIVALRDLGLPLKKIHEYLECRDSDRLDRLLEEQGHEIDRRIAQLRRSKALLQGLRAENRLFQAHCGRGYQLLDWPEERIAVLVDEDELSHAETAGMVVNYLTDGPYTGVYYCGQAQQFLYQKREDGERVLPGGRYLCLFDEEEENTTQEMRVEKIGQLRRYAAQQGWRLEQSVLIEFADILSARPGMQSFCLRARLQEAEMPGNADKAKDEIL